MPYLNQPVPSLVPILFIAVMAVVWIAFVVTLYSYCTKLLKNHSLICKLSQLNHDLDRLENALIYPADIFFMPDISFAAKCPFCATDVDASNWSCDICDAGYHIDCYQELTGCCAIYGCKGQLLFTPNKSN